MRPRGKAWQVCHKVEGISRADQYPFFGVVLDGYVNRLQRFGMKADIAFIVNVRIADNFNVRGASCSR